MAENILDVFNTDAFNVISMTDAINKLPYVPTRLGAMGLFKESGITTDTVVIEERDGHIALLQTAQRGTVGTTAGRATVKVRSFKVPHIPHDDTVLAQDVQGVREFGKASTTESVAKVVNERLAEMRQNHETTKEYYRAKAIQGLLLDADGSVIYDFWNEFGLTEQTVDFVLGTATTDIRGKCLTVAEKVEAAVGAMPYDHIHAMCGKTWFKSFVGHALVRDAYSRYKDGEMLRNDPRAGFEFGGIIFEVYRGAVSGQTFVNDDHARFFPVGAPGLFRQHNAPADFIEAVNTVGKPVYAKQSRMKFDKGIEIHTQSNPFIYCTRPYCLVKGFTSN
jgi:hypothetical protein